MWKEPLREAADKAGGMSALARAIGVPITTLQYWLDGRKSPYPAQFTIPIEKASGVSRHRLRPDVYGDATKESAA